ncbi:hypothetical protein FRC10_009626 [Ceratobasidium sp. 414]|nr:hypothetical protein FRC10_009626 [Ceratobasidium sp. 414]
MAPTFTIFQDPPSASTTRAPTFTSLTSASASTRSAGRLASSSTPVFALDADKENVDPSTGLARTTTKSKAKKAPSIKNKENPSKAPSKASKARGGSAAPGPAKPNTTRANPYHPVTCMPVSELSFQLAHSPPTPTPCLITGFSASILSDFAEPEFDLYSDFVDQPSPPRSRPDSMWSSALSPVAETAGDRKARDLTELPLADLSEAFATGAKKVRIF